MSDNELSSLTVIFQLSLENVMAADNQNHV